MSPLELGVWIASKGEELVSQQVRRSNSGAEGVATFVLDWASSGASGRAALAVVERLLAAA